MMRYLFLLLLAFPMMGLAAELEPIGWGVVSAMETEFYDKTGKNQGNVSGGELFQVLREIKMNKAPAYYVQLDRGAKKQMGILDAADCRYFPGPIPTSDDVNALVEYVGNQKLCKDYYSLRANCDRLVARQRDKHLANSPAKQLVSLKAELAEIPEKDRKCEAAMKKATTDAQRLKYRDMRKELRYRATGLQQEIKRLEAVADAWEKEHPFNDAAAKKSAVWKRFNAQAEKLRPQVEALCAKAAAPVASVQETP